MHSNAGVSAILFLCSRGERGGASTRRYGFAGSALCDVFGIEAWNLAEEDGGSTPVVPWHLTSEIDP